MSDKCWWFLGAFSNKTDSRAKAGTLGPTLWIRVMFRPRQRFRTSRTRLGASNFSRAREIGSDLKMIHVSKNSVFRLWFIRDYLRIEFFSWQLTLVLFNIASIYKTVHRSICYIMIPNGDASDNASSWRQSHCPLFDKKRQHPSRCTRTPFTRTDLFAFILPTAGFKPLYTRSR